jgi:hypothetical protein
MTKIDSVTPKYDITWYVKWAASIIVLVGITIRASGVTQLQWLDIVCSWIGAVGWFYVGFKWNDRALMVLNGVIGVILFAGILRVIFL